MKEKLEEKLKQQDPPGSQAWFYRKYIRDQIGITYSYFARMLDETSTLREDVKNAIETYISENA